MHLQHVLEPFFSDMSRGFLRRVQLAKYVLLTSELHVMRGRIGLIMNLFFRMALIRNLIIGLPSLAISL